MVSLGDVGEWGFLKKLLPALSRFKASRFAVPPGDDAAVLRKNNAVLSIDGLTEGTHFRRSWSAACKKRLGVPLARALGWKLLGGSLSDLAAMGDVRDRWAMIYLGAPGGTPMAFLSELFAGLRETALLYDCALAGGDTVRAMDISLVAAVGGTRRGARSLVRSGAKPGEALCIAGVVGDAAVGLNILEGRAHFSRADERFFMKRFFKPEPLFAAGAALARAGATSLMDLSDPLDDTFEILMKASRVGLEINIHQIPVSPAYARLFKHGPSLLAGGEDYSLLFTVPAKALSRLASRTPFRRIGEVTSRRGRASYFLNGARVRAPRSFSHFG